MRRLPARLRAALLAALTVVGTVVLVGVGIRPVLAPLTHRTPLPPAARPVDGVPVPRPAHRCATQDPQQPEAEWWCLPGGVSAATLAQWYEQALPPGRDADGLRWCVEQHLEDGSRRALWATDHGLVGYALPPEQPRPDASASARTAPGEELAVAVVRLADHPCPAAARASRR